ncbi:hydantoinase B/oxoprolinase family protein [Celeribacter halophilus]|uniref:hydantoinase B/oxoprolinase family protein n=1 Tax=Celeribacter halophilus TaxID=576117 RepID=UPI001C09E755|nr:hydantoinase B/oxoprolinase family protein [Celeribacter halophilus]MBU2888121.1 hydantoinase B/oxoprolinase family protein [Celeribacter halophilus]MDO6511867.1 hydantoinase B/oxoprolinase family protein [Celeribacter halophilus]
MARELNEIERQILWNRLIAIVEEQAQTLMRTAFNPIVRESGDLSAGIFDIKGRMIAQAVTGTPGHVNTMAESVSFFLNEFPLEDMHPEDIYLTNDPWKAAGHLNDFMLVRPCFHNGELIGFTSCTSHLADLGGLGFGPDGSDVLDEGLFVPIFKLVDAGRLDTNFIRILKANSRVPIEVEGDLYALMACVECGSRRLSECMADVGITSLEDIANYIIDTSRSRTNELIRALPEGVYHNTMRIDGYDRPLDLEALMTIKDGEITVDYTGTSGLSEKGINCPLNYASAYSCFALKCAIAPDIPNNAGSLEPLKITAPKNTIVNAQYPVPVAMRHVVGQLLPDVVFGCLHKARAGLAPAEGACCLWDLPLRGGYAVNAVQDKTRFATELVHNGGTGARPTKDGLSATAFPSGVMGSLVEITESVSPLIIWKREYRQDSGGPGRQRGGLGQVLELSSSEDAPISLFAALDRINHPARGREGGCDGAAGVLMLSDGTRLNPKGEQIIPGDQRLIMLTPGGAGYGSPIKREPADVVCDVLAGLVSPESAEADYGIRVEADGSYSFSGVRAQSEVGA